MIPTRPEPTALPGMLPQPGNPFTRAARWLSRHGVRLRYELAPVVGAAVYATTIDVYADGGHNTEPAFAFGIAAGGCAAVSAFLIAKDDSEPVASYRVGSASAALAWGSWQFASDGSLVPGVVLGSVLTALVSIPYWRSIGARHERDVDRAEHRMDRDTDVEIAKIKAMEAAFKARAKLIPGQRDAPAIETVGQQAADRPSVPWQPPGNTSVRQPVRIGPNTDVDIVGGHMLIAGRTRAGKSVLQNGIISSLLPCEDALVVGIDMKFGGVELRPYEKVGVRVAFNADDAEAVIDWVIEQARRRGEQLGVSFEDTGTIKKAWHATPAERHIVLVIDEVAELTRQAPKTAEKLETILAVTTGLGVTAVLGTQLSSSGVFGGRTDGPANIDTVACLGTKSPLHTRMILGEDATKLGYDAHLLERQGEFYIRSHRHRVPAVDRSFEMTDRMLEDHLHSLGCGPVVAKPRDVEPEVFAAPTEPVVEQSGRLENATSLITEYLRHNGPATPQQIADGIGHPSKAANVRSLLSRHVASGFFGTDKRGTYWLVGAKTVAGNVVPLATRRNR